MESGFSDTKAGVEYVQPMPMWARAVSLVTCLVLFASMIEVMNGTKPMFYGLFLFAIGLLFLTIAQMHSIEYIFDSGNDNVLVRSIGLVFDHKSKYSKDRIMNVDVVERRSVGAKVLFQIELYDGGERPTYMGHFQTASAAEIWKLKIENAVGLPKPRD